MDGMDREERKAQVQENIGYIAFTGHDRETVDELVERHHRCALQQPGNLPHWWNAVKKRDC